MFTEKSEQGEVVESQEHVQQHCFDLPVMSDIEKEVFRKRLEASGGVARAFVHPFYEDHDQGGEAGSLYVKDRFKGDRVSKEEIQQVFFKLLKMPKEKTPPLLIFEERSFLGGMEEILEKNVGTEMQNDLYIVPTVNDGSIPVRRPGDPGDAPSRWQKFNASLKELGLKKVLIGGMYLIKGGPASSQRYAGCVGQATEALQNDFEVEISALSYPQNRSDFHASRS